MYNDLAIDVPPTLAMLYWYRIEPTKITFFNFWIKISFANFIKIRKKNILKKIQFIFDLELDFFLCKWT